MISDSIDNTEEALADTKVLAPKSLKLFKNSLKIDILSGIGLILILIIFRLKVISEINNYLIGSFDGDAGLYAWLSLTNTRDLFTLQWFDKLFFFPYGKALAWSDNYIIPALLSRVFELLGASSLTSFNLIILIANFLNGFLTYKLLYRLSGEAKVAFSSGAAFMTSSYLTYQLGHPQLQFVFFIPLALYTLFRFLKKPSYWKSFQLGLIFSSSFLTTIYYTYFSFLACCSVIIASYLLRPKNLNLKELFQLLFGIILGILPLIPFILPYLQVREAFGGRGIYEAYYFAASLWSYLSATPYNLIYQVSSSLSDGESHLFPGITITGFSIAAVMRLTQATKLRKLFNWWVFSIIVFMFFYTLCSGTIFRLFCSITSWAIIIILINLIIELGRTEKRLGVDVITARSLIAIFLFLATISFLVSLGPLANPEKGQFALTPYWVLYKIIPGFDSIRAISRTGILFYFALTLLFGLALSRLTTRTEWRRAAFLPLAFVLVENFNIEYPLSKLLDKPLAITELEKIVAPGAAILLPFAGELDSNNEVKSWSEFARINVTSMNWFKDIKRPYINGYSGQKTKLMRELPRELKDFPSPRAIRALSQIAGLKFLIYYPSFNKDHDDELFIKKLSSLKNHLKIISAPADGSYLIELVSEETIDPQFEIIAPARNSLIQFEIRSLYKVDKELIKVSIINKDDPQINTIETISLKPDGSWQTFAIKAPLNRNRIRPFRINFKYHDVVDLPFKIRNIRSE